MPIKQFVKIQWKDNIPYFKLSDSKGSIEYINAYCNLKLAKLDRKFCVGYYNLQDMTDYPCKHMVNVTYSKYSRCNNCENLMGFGLCVMCKGSVCNARNENALEFCKKDHVLYLAYFPNNVKVGTTVYERRYERMLEQGAIFSLFIARTNGMNIRKIETAISQLGLTAQVSQSYKLKTLLEYPDTKTAQEVLLEKLTFIQKNIRNDYTQYFISPEFNDFGFLLKNIDIIPTPFAQDLFGNPIKINPQYKPYEIMSNITSISGLIITVIGSIAIIKMSNKFFALNFKDLYGWVVDYQIDAII